MEFDFIGIFTLVTGILFLILEIRQNNWMWLFQLLSGFAAMVSFFTGGLYASAALNLYYVVMAFVGFAQWRRDDRVSDPRESTAPEIHLRHLTPGTALMSLVILVTGTVALFFLLRFLDDPKSVGDAGATVLSCIATWWLAKSYPQQWLLWIFADAVSAWICLSQGMTAMSLLYIIYALSAIYGYIHWIRRGKYIDRNGQNGEKCR